MQIPRDEVCYCNPDKMPTHLRGLPEFCIYRGANDEKGWPDNHMLEAAMGIISNVDSGNWNQRADWLKAARQWLEAYARLIPSVPLQTEGEYLSWLEGLKPKSPPSEPRTDNDG
jgi:hypothetical protein